MLDKKQVQESIGRIDNALAQLNVNREGHIILTNDVKLVQTVCMEQFKDKVEKKEDERTDEPVDDTEPGDQDS